MIKLVFCVRKRRDLGADEFHRYWLEEHGPLVESVQEAMGAVRYVQSHTVEPEVNALLQASRGSRDAYDGITEVWWESRADLEKGLATEEGRAAAERLLADERTFIDLEASTLFLTEEEEIFGP